LEVESERRIEVFSRKVGENRRVSVILMRRRKRL